MKHNIREILHVHDSDITDSHFANAKLANCRFQNVNFRQSHFSHVNFSDATFDDVNLTNASITCANLAGMRIKRDSALGYDPGVRSTGDPRFAAKDFAERHVVIRGPFPYSNANGTDFFIDRVEHG